MRIPLDPQSRTPLYRQIEDWFRENIHTGGLPPDVKIPSTRDLADELGVSRITVKNAYANLESDGLIYTREGSGTFVASLFPEDKTPSTAVPANWPFWQLEATEEIQEPVEVTPAAPIRDDLISFIGVGDPRAFPLKDFTHTIRDVLESDGTTALEYGGLHAGYYPLRKTISQILASQGIQSRPEEVLITAGSQQGLSLVCQTLLKPGDVVIVEKPTYNFALELFRALRLKIIGIPVDRQGMQVEQLEPVLQQYHPRMIYSIPVFQNPGGMCLSAPRRRLLLELASCYNVPILEDDFVSDLRFEGRALPAIKSLDKNGQVIYIGTFSKMLMPGLRIGYLLARGPIFERLVRQKWVQDLATSNLMQRVLDRYVTVGRYQAHLRRSTRLYRKRRDAMVAALRRYLPPSVSFDVPHGGLFLWLRLPEDMSCLDLLPLAMQNGVEFSPGTRYFPDPEEGKPNLRLNFATHTPQEIEEGIRRLAVTLSKIRE
ncbi:MAG: PLP-dependent aminotransferase family protein [Leptolinea sp.]|jgi:GntR family transcriptional regulator/MocR family aminotransferase|nr:PLP-dependent aminotransferase family protein [Leptolinea sp.]